jgi:hypothetical protein
VGESSGDCRGNPGVGDMANHNGCERMSMPVGGKLVLELSFVVKSFKG